MGEPERPESLISLFEQIRDPRSNRTKAYSLPAILFLTLSAVVSGVNHVTDVEMFGRAKMDWLRAILPHEGGIPSHDTIGRVLGMLNPDEAAVAGRSATPGQRFGRKAAKGSSKNNLVSSARTRLRWQGASEG